MKRFRFVLVTIALIVSLGCASGQDVRSEHINVSERNWDSLRQYLVPALKSAGGVGRLYYRADCLTERGDGILFPRLGLVNPAKSRNGLVAIQGIFRKERQVSVTEGPSGIYRISVGNVNYELLKTKIQVLEFTPRERYNVRDAISAIERTREVERKKRELRLENPPIVVTGRVLEPAAGLPHLPISLRNVTMDEALDRVGQTFGELIIYGECVSGSGRRLFNINSEYVR
jgi:hypothetical protein